MNLPKVAGVVGVSVLLLTAAFWTGARYAEGRAAVAQKAAIERALNEQRERLERQHAIALAGLEREQVIVEQIRYVEREIPRVETPECERLGDDWLRLFNAAITD